MGLANLVPGISGGTMLLAAGVYKGFVDGIASVSTLRFRRPDLVLLVSIVASALVAILLFAGPIKELVIHQRWVMFSLFIGLTLGGVPIVWKMARPATPALWRGVAAGFALMLGVALAGGLDQGAGSGYGMSVAAGIAGASAMILPGISGSYLLLLMGQYLPILDAVDTLKVGLGARDFAMIGQSMHVVIPVGIGVVVGVVGLSNLLKRLLEQRPQPTLGFLLGLLFGSVLGLWPFEQTVDVLPLGESLKGVVITAENLAELTRTVDREDWPAVSYVPGLLRVILATAIAAFGYALTWLIARLGIGRT
jgi:putative membrane protein